MLNKNIIIRNLDNNKKLPYDLLLLADPSRELVDEYLKQSYVFVADVNNKTVGVCVLYHINRNKAEIKNIAVDPQYQKQGIGNTLMKEVIKQAADKGYKELIIGTGNNGFSQLYMYQRLGFEMTEIIRNFFIDNYKEPIFENGLQCKHMIILTKDLTENV